MIPNSIVLYPTIIVYTKQLEFNKEATNAISPFSLDILKLMSGMGSQVSGGVGVGLI